MTEAEHADTRLEWFLKSIVENTPAFRAFVRKRLGDEAIAEDVLQQCLVRAVANQHTLENQESIIPWFYRILRNAITDYYRSRAVQKSRHQSFEKEAQVLNPQEVPSLDEVKATVCGCLERVVQSLRPSYRELIQRIDLGEETTAAVAQDLGISSTNATVRLHRARQALRGSLEQTVECARNMDV